MSPRQRAGARRRSVLGAGACLLGWPLARAASRDAPQTRESRPLMGTRVDIAVRDAAREAAGPGIDAAFERMAFLASVMSHYSPTSRVGAVNLAAGIQPVPVPPELMQVLAMAQRLSRATGGAFDVTVGSLGVWDFDPQSPHLPSESFIRARLPVVGWRHLALDERAGTAHLQRRGMRLDLGGIAKLYILQAGLDTLRAHGVRDALVNGGGDVVATSARGSPPWRVGIRDPRAPQRLLGAIDVREGFVASSGDYERFVMRGGTRWHHVIDPKTGHPTQGPHGATLVGHDIEAVNGLGTAAMVLGFAAGRDLIERTRGVQGLIAGGDGALWVGGRLRDRLVA